MISQKSNFATPAGGFIVSFFALVRHISPQRPSIPLGGASAKDWRRSGRDVEVTPSDHGWAQLTYPATAIYAGNQCACRGGALW